MKLRNLALSLIAVTLLGGCTGGEMYTPKVGGVIDTLHNEVHVPTVNDLYDPETGEIKIEDPSASKIYITDNDGFRYVYNPMTNTFDLIEKTDTIINFFFDSMQTTVFVEDKEDSHHLQKQVEAPIYVADWFKTKPLPEMPEEIDTEAEIIARGEIYGFKPKEGTHWVGWSIYPSCLGDEDHLWKFGSDYRQQPITNLYGIWVEE